MKTEYYRKIGKLQSLLNLPEAVLRIIYSFLSPRDQYLALGRDSDLKRIFKEIRTHAKKGSKSAVDLFWRMNRIEIKRTVLGRSLPSCEYWEAMKNGRGSAARLEALKTVGWNCLGFIRTVDRMIFGDPYSEYR